ncbi:MFS transporter [Brevibacterium casei]|nr:MFS transporter [Brevibacterium casei]
MMPQILASIQHALFGAERLKAISLFGAFSGVGTVSGQVIGGGLISAFGPTWGWRAAFLSARSLLWPLSSAHFGSPNPAHRHRRRSTSAGPYCSASGWSASSSDSPSVPSPDGCRPATLLVVSAAALAAFAVWQSVAEARGRDPLIPPQVVRAPAAWVGMLMSFVFFGGFGTFLFNFALTSQTGHGDPAFVSGMTLGLFAAAFLAVSLLVPRIVRRLSGPGTMPCSAPACRSSASSASPRSPTPPVGSSTCGSSRRRSSSAPVRPSSSGPSSGPSSAPYPTGWRD